MCFKYTDYSFVLFKGWFKFTLIKTHSSESQGQGGRSKRHPDGLETHMREYITGTRVVKIENAITKEP